MNSFGKFNETLKAYAAMVVTAAGYLVGVLTSAPEGQQGLGDLSTAQWLGLVVFMGSAYGLTYAAKNKPAGDTKGSA